jgi:hypothetical protein
MSIHFLNDGSDFRSRSSGGGSLTKGRGDTTLFWWTILITLLMGLATFCWFFSIMVFKYPEKPFHYKLLTKLEKLEPIQKFDPLKIPNGTFVGPRDLLAKYYNYNPEQLHLANDLLKRSYILNYTTENPVYVKGTYVVMFARPLKEGDVMKEGWVIRARSEELEDVQVELLLPGAKSAESPFKPDQKFTLDNKNHICCVINVERNRDTDGVCATVAPLTYAGFTTPEKKAIAITPPTKLNMEAGWPVLANTPIPAIPVDEQQHQQESDGAAPKAIPVAEPVKPANTAQVKLPR